jgi:rhomboid family GlyGly-CTERM serine protease
MTGHLTHFEANHLIWDIGALLVLGSVAEHESRRRFIRVVLWSAVTISAAVWWWQPQFEHYRGLSGIDSALFALIAGSLLCRRRAFSMVAASFALLAFGGKCMFELATSSTVFAAGSAYAPVPLAHLVGLVVGLVVAFTPDCRRDQSAHAGRVVPLLS